jgi:hypothetical protein
LIASSVQQLLVGFGVPGPVCGLGDAEARLREMSGSPTEMGVVYYYYLADALSLIVLSCRAGAMFGRGFVSVCGDTDSGRTIRLVLEQLGRRTLPLRFASPGARFNDVKRLVAERAPITIAADGLGVNGRVDEGLARLVGGRRSLAVPVGVCASASLEFECDRRILRPLPGATIGVAVGAPVAVEIDGPDVVAVLEAGLEATRAAAAGLVAQG